MIFWGKISKFEVIQKHLYGCLVNSQKLGFLTQEFPKKILLWKCKMFDLCSFLLIIVETVLKKDGQLIIFVEHMMSNDETMLIFAQYSIFKLAQKYYFLIFSLKNCISVSFLHIRNLRNWTYFIFDFLLRSSMRQLKRKISTNIITFKLCK